MSASVLKLIALISMITDHSGAVLGGYSAATGAPLDVGLYFALRAAGRAAFMIYAFFIAEGCRKSRDFGKYILRLGVFALVSEVPYDLLFENFKYAAGWRQLTFLEFGRQNVFFTLFFGALAIYLWEWKAVKYKALNLPLSLCPIALAWLLKTDYGAPGAAFILLIYLLMPVPFSRPADFAGNSPESPAGPGSSPNFRLEPLVRRSLQILAVMGFSVYLYYNISHALWLIAGGWGGALLLGFYNGKRGFGGKRGKWVKWFFYIAYPAHLLALAAVFREIAR